MCVSLVVVFFVCSRWRCCGFDLRVLCVCVLLFFLLDAFGCLSRCVLFFFASRCVCFELVLRWCFSLFVFVSFYCLHVYVYFARHVLFFAFAIGLHYCCVALLFVVSLHAFVCVMYIFLCVLFVVLFSRLF